MKTRLSESGAKAETITECGNVHCDWFIHLLLLPTPTIWFSLDHKWNLSDRVISGVGGTKFVNGNVLILLTCFDSDSVMLLTPCTHDSDF